MAYLGSFLKTWFSNICVQRKSWFTCACSEPDVRNLKWCCAWVTRTSPTKLSGGTGFPHHLQHEQRRQFTHSTATDWMKSNKEAKWWPWNSLICTPGFATETSEIVHKWLIITVFLTLSPVFSMRQKYAQKILGLIMVLDLKWLLTAFMEVQNHSVSHTCLWT